jgi:hypothetical protein
MAVEIGSFIGHIVLTNTTSSLYSVCLSVLGHEHDNVNRLLEELDIVARIQTMDALVKGLEKKYPVIGDEKECDLSDPVKIALNNLHVINEKIHKILKDIDTEIKYHKTKYWNEWRTPDYHLNLIELRRNSKIMEKRFELLIKLMSIDA